MCFVVFGRLITAFIKLSWNVSTDLVFLIFRYLAIFFPTTTRLTPQRCYLIITFIWLIPMCVFIPWAVAFSERTVPIRDELTHAVYVYTTCMEVWSSMSTRKAYFLGVVFLTCYVLPLCFIAVFYLMIGIKVWKRRVAGIRGTRAERNIHRSKIRIVRMLLTVFIIFVLSWLPLYSLHLRGLFGPMPGSTEKVILRRYITPLVQWLGAANSCVNPFIYCYFSLHFRRSIIAVVQSRSCSTPITDAWQKSAATGCRESIRMAQLWQKSPPAEGREQGRLTVYWQQEQDEYMETMFNMILI